MSDEVWTILKVLQWTQRRFTERGLRTPRLDAELLLAHVLTCDRVSLYTHHDQPLAKIELEAYRSLIKRRLAGQPVAYLIGRQEFWSLPFLVDERVLIPRPETEGLVECALAALQGRAAPRVADICTGSGAVAVAIGHERSDAELVAVDASHDALAVARQNAEHHEVQMQFFEGDLFAPLTTLPPFDVIVANPPYIAERDFGTLPADVRSEPRLALIAGSDGFSVLHRLVDGALHHLHPGGVLGVEVGAGQAGDVAERMRQRDYVDVNVARDLAGIERIVSGRRASS